MTNEREDCLVVSGAGSGIGRAIARGAAKQGIAVAVWDIDANAADAVADEIRRSGGRSSAIGVDVSDGQAVADALERTMGWHVPNLLVNNAGPPSAQPRPFADGVNAVVSAVEVVTSAWLHRVRDRAEAVVNVASIAGTTIGGGTDWYSTGKAGVLGFTRYLAASAPHGLRANAVAPGLVETPRMTDYLSSEVGQRMVARTPRRSPVQPDEVAAAVLFLLSPAAAAITGTALTVDAGMSLTA
ncbi:SDR family NAD(P)-dependent oxidoreductase [Rhodococcus opacus]|uniref:3-oxoacyl-[acyl-carrier-protein] reductase MabA n=1 Tax=Rhodococcus opacus TaxID=37919 RepID=A0A076EYP2_RHOOP|nr:SDR family oxidoreductase [Rhodococcus opacus]AII10543.1 hypothetical protein EP51_40540 [Rhodococcus opacus]